MMASQIDTDKIDQLEAQIADMQAQLAELKEKSKSSRKTKKGSKEEKRDADVEDVKAALAFLKCCDDNYTFAKQVLAVAWEIHNMEPDPGDEPAESEPTAEEEFAEIDEEIAQLRESHPTFDVVVTATRKEKALMQPEGPIVEETAVTEADRSQL